MRQYLILAAAALAAFGAGLGGSFHFDDYSLFSDPAALRTRPLAALTFRLNYLLGGHNPAGYLAINLALHVAVTLLLWRVLRRLLSPRAALIAALLFAVHPAASEAVLYIFARPILLATLLALASVRAWLDGRRWFAVAWFVAALLAKEEVAALPAGLLLVEWWRSQPLRESAAPLATMALASVAAAGRVIWLSTRLPGAGVGAAAGLTPFQYFAGEGAAILRYLRLLVIPWGFTVDPQIHASWLAWAAVALLIAMAVRLRAAWFLAGLVLLIPSSSIFPAADLAADHRLYWPLTAFAVGGGVLLERVNTRYIGAIVVVLAALSFGRTQAWRTERSLWTEAVRRAPGKLRPKIQLARALPAADRIGLLQGIEDPRALAELGRAQLELGRPAEALAEFGRALALAPRDPMALNNRGVALLALGQREAARQDFERALAADPCLFEALRNLHRAPPTGCRYTPDQERALRGNPR